MITSVQWEGGIDGELTLGLDQEIVKIDRPGDLVATMMEQSCEPDLQASALIYGYCLATQGVQLPHLVRQVLKKTGPSSEVCRWNRWPCIAPSSISDSSSRITPEKGMSCERRSWRNRPAITRNSPAPEDPSTRGPFQVAMSS